jgi:hypothetical protein
MRLICLASGGCRWDVIREEWVLPNALRPYSLLVRHHQCRYCLDTKATITSPKTSESFFCIPDKLCTDLHENEA